MRIREATACPADLLSVTDLARRFLAGTDYGRIITTDTDHLTVLCLLTIQHGVIFLAEDDERGVFGMIAILAAVSPWDGSRYGDELAWWVNPEARSVSAGPRLLWAAEQWARQKGLSVLKMVAPAGTDIGAFYQRCGYTPVETAFRKSL